MPRMTSPAPFPAVRRAPGRAGAALLALAAGACASMHESEDYLRHRDSQLVMPLDGGPEFYFDARLSPSLPADDPAAEARRIGWLEGWLRLRKLCADGYDILERRPFRFEESNPGRFDLRYVLRCKPPPDDS